jgi:FkbM family methyltransferase
MITPCDHVRLAGKSDRSIIDAIIYYMRAYNVVLMRNSFLYELVRSTPTGKLLWAAARTGISLLHPYKQKTVCFPRSSYWEIRNISNNTRLCTPDPRNAYDYNKYRKNIYKRFTYEGFVEFESDDTVVDVGSFVGGYTLAVANSASKVIAVEPSSINSHCIRRNASDFDNITVIECIAWKKNKILELNLSPDPTDNSVFTPDNGKLLKKDKKIALQLDTICSIADLDTVDFLKIDAEGAEPEVLEGINSVEINKLAIACGPERDGEPTVTDTVDILKKEGYETKTQGNVVFGKN